VYASLLVRSAVLGAVVVGVTVATSGSAVATAARGAVGESMPDLARPLTAPDLASRPALPPGQRYVCPAPERPGQMECMSIIATRPHGEAGWATPWSASNSYNPADLRSAYMITEQAARGGGGETVAIVDAYNDPRAASNLSTYRKHFGLTACAPSTGCLKIVNEFGRTSPLPAGNASWATEESLDLDMVSAICPRCHIVLVEARTPSIHDLGIAEDTAVEMGARYVSNSWAGAEFYGQDVYDSDFNHPGDVVVFAAGDSGYGPAYPADLQYVTAVGGTTLKHASNSRGWTETVWGATNSDVTGGTGGGCSTPGHRQRLQPPAPGQEEEDRLRPLPPADVRPRTRRELGSGDPAR
jgi:hypothetical protein